jgi:hypothetical protein
MSSKIKSHLNKEKIKKNVNKAKRGRLKVESGFTPQAA